LAFHSRREADHSPLSSAEVKEWVELYLYSPNVGELFLPVTVAKHFNFDIFSKDLFAISKL
jgi:hypothetical protein